MNKDDQLVQKATNLHKEWIHYIRDKAGTGRFKDLNPSLALDHTPFNSSEIIEIVKTFDNMLKRKDGKL